MEVNANIVMLPGKKLLGTARNHSIIADRPIEDGGTDSGFTSGELLLLAIGSCASGGLRRYFISEAIDYSGFCLNVYFEPSATRGARDRIVIELCFAVTFDRDTERIKAAALSGRVVSRLAAGSELEVRFVNGSSVNGTIGSGGSRST